MGLLQPCCILFIAVCPALGTQVMCKGGLLNEYKKEHHIGCRSPMGKS